jgi:Cell wall-active antibiotics response 4TMS YvqF
VTSDGLPAEAEPPISEELRQRGINVLQGYLASGKMELDSFAPALDGLLGVRTEAEFASAMRSLPPPVDITPPGRRRQEPLEITSSMNAVRLEGRWQVGRQTNVSTGMGAVTIDLSEAEFDAWDIELVVHTEMGAITVVVPRGFDVRLTGRNGAVKSDLEPPVPGFPVVRLSATSDMGTIRVVHPTVPRRRRWRRRQSTLQP